MSYNCNFTSFTNENSASINYGSEPGLIRVFQIEYRRPDGSVFLDKPCRVEESLEKYYDDYVELMSFLGDVDECIPTGRALFLGYYKGSDWYNRTTEEVIKKATPVDMVKYMNDQGLIPREIINEHIPFYYNTIVKQKEEFDYAEGWN